MSDGYHRDFQLTIEARQYRLKREALLLEYPELGEDEETLLDTLDGCTSITEQLAALAREALAAKYQAEGLKAYQEALDRRRSRLVEREDRIRRMLLRHMTESDIKKVAADDLTVSRRPLPQSVIITDERAIPAELCRITCTPDKTAIKAALVAGEPVDGAALSNGGETISIRV